MEEAGYMATNEGLINTDEFRKVCISCNVDPDSFTPSDLDMLAKKLE